MGQLALLQLAITNSAYWWRSVRQSVTRKLKENREKKHWLRLHPLTFHVHWSLLIFPGSVFTTFRKVLLPFTAADMSKPLRQKETRSQFLSSWIVTSHQLHRVTSGQITNSSAAVQNIRHQTNSQNLANSSGYNTVNSKCSQVNTVNNKNNLNIYISINYKWQM